MVARPSANSPSRNAPRKTELPKSVAATPSLQFSSSLTLLVPQRAFRQRKEGYIKKLEQQVRDYNEMDLNYKGLQAENYTLRDYIVRLQSRLLDTQGDYPQPPAGVSLAHPTQAQQQLRHPGGPDVSQQTANALAPGANPLEVAAQAVAGLTRGEHLAARDPYGAPVHTADDDVRTAEEITRQLKAEGGSDGLPTAAM